MYILDYLQQLVQNQSLAVWVFGRLPLVLLKHSWLTCQTTRWTERWLKLCVFLSHSRELRSTEARFHSSFWPFLNQLQLHPILGNNGQPKLFPMLHFQLPKPSPPHSWKQFKTSFGGEKKKDSPRSPKILVKFDQKIPCHQSSVIKKIYRKYHPRRSAHNSHGMCKKNQEQHWNINPMSCAKNIG